MLDVPIMRDGAIFGAKREDSMDGVVAGWSLTFCALACCKSRSIVILQAWNYLPTKIRDPMVLMVQVFVRQQE